MTGAGEVKSKDGIPAVETSQRREEIPHSVFVIDDDASVREGLADLLASIGMNVLSFGSAQEFLTTRRPDASGCAILDVCMPGMTGLDLQRELNAACVDLPIIFLTGRGDIPMTVQALKAGAAHFLTKPVREWELIEAVNRALETDRQQRRMRVEMEALRNRFQDLSPREREVMVLVASGLLNKQIAYAIGISERTVKLYRGQMMRKMGTQSLAELVKQSEKLGLRKPLCASASGG